VLLVGKRTIRAKYHSRTLTGRFVQDDSHNNGDDSHADGADSCKQAVMLSNIISFKLRLNYIIYQRAVCALLVEFFNLYIYL